MDLYTLESDVPPLKIRRFRSIGNVKVCFNVQQTQKSFSAMTGEMGIFAAVS